MNISDDCKTAGYDIVCCSKCGKQKDDIEKDEEKCPPHINLTKKIQRNCHDCSYEPPNCSKKNVDIPGNCCVDPVYRYQPIVGYTGFIPYMQDKIAQSYCVAVATSIDEFERKRAQIICDENRCNGDSEPITICCCNNS